MDSFIEDDGHEVAEPYYITKHKKAFGVEPNIIGLLWRDEDALAEAIIDAILEGKPYDEYEALSKEEKEAYDRGDLLF